MGLRWKWLTSASDLHSHRSSQATTKPYGTRRKPMRHAWLRCLPLLVLLPLPAGLAQTQANSFTTLQQQQLNVAATGQSYPHRDRGCLQGNWRYAQRERAVFQQRHALAGNGATEGDSVHPELFCACHRRQFWLFPVRSFHVSLRHGKYSALGVLDYRADPTTGTTQSAAHHLFRPGRKSLSSPHDGL
jgi:hypothetical protein